MFGGFRPDGSCRIWSAASTRAGRRTDGPARRERAGGDGGADVIDSSGVRFQRGEGDGVIGEPSLFFEDSSSRSSPAGGLVGLHLDGPPCEERKRGRRDKWRPICKENGKKAVAKTSQLGHERPEPSISLMNGLTSSHLEPREKDFQRFFTATPPDGFSCSSSLPARGATARKIGSKGFLCRFFSFWPFISPEERSQGVSVSRRKRR